MNIIPQMKLFEESDFENLGDLERLQMVLFMHDHLEHFGETLMVDGKAIQALEPN